MIYDSLKDIGKYKGTNKNLDAAIDYVMSHDLNELALGRNEVDGDRVFINVMEATAKPASEVQYEIHHYYYDIQIDLKGVERIDIGDAATFAGEYHEEGDGALGTADTKCQCVIGEGNFIICMPYEPHKPTIAACDNTAVKKAVVKVHI